MMMNNDNDIETFVRLKYEILTSAPDSDTWKRCCDTYPASVKSKWAWRCAADVEHLAGGHPKAEKCIRIAKLYREDGAKATLEKLKKAWREVPYSADYAGAYHAAAAYSATAADYAATYEDDLLHCREFTIADWWALGRGARWVNSFARLFSRLL